MQISCQGYSQKLPVLLDLILEELANFKVKPDRFAVIAEAVAREYANVAYQQPYQWAMYRAEVKLLCQFRFKIHNLLLLEPPDKL